MLSASPFSASAEPGSTLDRILCEAVPLQPDARAAVLVESDALEAAHSTAASKGDTAPPQLQDEVEHHYVCFVASAKGNLWELDGRRIGPINRGPLREGEDVLSERALDLGVRSFLKREEGAGGGDLRFSLVALSQNFE